MEDTVYWVWLQAGLGIGSKTADQVLEAGISPKELYHMGEKELEQLRLFTKNQILRIRRAPLSNAEEICRECGQRGYQLVTPDMEIYPNRLLQIQSAPLVLYVEGNIGCLEEFDLVPAISIVGTRRASAYGQRVAFNLSYDLAKAGFTIVSGLALGVDGEAHAGAVRAEGTTIAVLGCGLDKNYPAENSKLRGQLLQKGAVLSEYPPGLQPIARNFPVRNRIISGLSLGVAVVEAGNRSGSLITAGHALAQGRDVFAVPTDIYDPNGQGTLKLIQDGAKPILSAQDIINEYSWRFEKRIFTAQETNTTSAGKMVKPRKLEPEHGRTEKRRQAEKVPSLLDTLTEHQKLVYHLLTAEPQGIEPILYQSGLSLHEVLAIMTELELYGLLKAYPGKQFSRSTI